MGKAMPRRVQQLTEGTRVLNLVYCTACKTHHAFGEGWSFNGDFEYPTFQPSMLVRSGHYIPGHEDPCWCTYNAAHPDNHAPFECKVCHSFVTDGKIQYLSDCTHEYAGQTLELQDIDDLWDSWEKQAEELRKKDMGE
jgi:hypothetical protein